MHFRVNDNNDEKDNNGRENSDVDYDDTDDNNNSDDKKKISKNVENYILNFHVDDANLSNSEVFEHT